MPDLKVNQPAPGRRRGVARLSLGLGLYAAVLGSCVTTEPKTEVVVVAVDTAPVPEPVREVEAPVVGGRAEVSPPPPIVTPAPPILAETLQPVRGGARALPAYHGARPCKMALTGSSPVAKACSDGGIKKALDLMQLFVKRAKKEGFVFQCADCHPDEDDLSVLAPDADSRFRELLFLARPAD
ncbi:MAG TPA: hypothetical protein VH374_23170 [Polyangia bacterium]|jgi:hypothetical protein|nr:hypothetical protein [Polyangia bacterium]